MDKEDINAIYKLHAEFCQTLADANRLLIIVELHQCRELPVNTLAEKLDLPQANVSKHLAIMRERGLVNHRRDGSSVYYSLADKRIYDAIRMLIEVQAELMKRHQRLTRGIASLAAEGRQR